MSLSPVRTCIGCRKRAERHELVRLVSSLPSADAPLLIVVVDEAKTLPGRGAWVHQHPDCWAAAVKRRAVQRALRVTRSLDATAVNDWFDVNVAAHPSSASIEK